MLATQDDEDPCTIPPMLSTPQNSSPWVSPNTTFDCIDPENPFTMMHSAIDGDESNSGNCVGVNGDKSLGTWFEVQLDEETAGLVIPHDQQPSQEPDNTYAPWSLKAEWELIHWLGTSQLSGSNIDKFIQLEWVSKSLLTMEQGLTTGIRSRVVLPL